MDSANHPSNTDPEKLRLLIKEMVTTITAISDDVNLKTTVGSVFGSMSVAQTYEELKAYNEGKGAMWIFRVNDPRDS
jgi:hypothetical protein